MALDKEFQDKIKSLIDECFIPNVIHTLECDIEHCGFHVEEDFKYGHKAGVVMGITLVYYIAKYGKLPTDVDLTEMTEMVELRKDEIKKSFADIHFFYKV